MNRFLIAIVSARALATAAQADGHAMVSADLQAALNQGGTVLLTGGSSIKNLRPTAWALAR